MRHRRNSGVRGTYLVAAAVHVQIGGGRDTGDQSEESAEDVEDEREDGVDREGVLDRDEGEVEEGQHAEDGDEHVIVDDRGPAGHGEHVTDEGHADEDEEELRAVIVRDCCECRFSRGRDRIPEVLEGRLGR